MRPKKVILLVEPNEQTRSIRRFLLKNHGYAVLSVSNSEAALEVVKGHMPGSIDLLLTAAVIGGVRGRDLIDQAKQVHPDLPTMSISGVLLESVWRTPADTFLLRGDFTNAEMFEGIRRLTTRRRGPKPKKLVDVAHA